VVLGNKGPADEKERTNAGARTYEGREKGRNYGKEGKKGGEGKEAR
jgi:hypothetical protein